MIAAIALAAWSTLCFLTGDPVAMVIQLRDQIDGLIAGMTAQQRADLAQYEQPRHLRVVA